MIKDTLAQAIRRAFGTGTHTYAWHKTVERELDAWADEDLYTIIGNAQNPWKPHTGFVHIGDMTYAYCVADAEYGDHWVCELTDGSHITVRKDLTEWGLPSQAVIDSIPTDAWKRLKA